MMGQARRWSLRKTTWITVLCGLGHVAGSVAIGMVGIGLGIGVGRLEFLESVRGNLAAWVLIAFGLVYFVWGLRRALRNRPHEHRHTHFDGLTHSHTHVHSEDHSHVHDEVKQRSITPWVLFTIFVLGPCEPLIPLLIYPAAKSSFGGVILVTAIFAVVTIATMVAVVLASSLGFKALPTARVERYSHAIAGATIGLCGAAIQFMGL
jgi:ABC-type nickel/cobalt efflux system permease component RcnA